MMVDDYVIYNICTLIIKLSSKIFYQIILNKIKTHYNETISTNERTKKPKRKRASKEYNT